MANKTSVSTSERVTPNPMLLALVSQYLKNNGFNSAHRIFNTERKKRPKKEGWQDTFGKNYTENLPPLEAIFQTWKEEHSNRESSASEEGDDDSSSSDSDDSSSSSNREKANSSEAESRSESSSDSDSDDEGNDVVAAEQKAKALATAKREPVASATSKTVRSLKRKAPDSSPESSDSRSAEDDTSGSDDESESEAEAEAHLAKKQRITESSSSSESDSDSDSDSGSESDSDSEQAPSTNILPALETRQKIANMGKEASDNGSSSGNSSDSESSSERDEAPGDTVPVLEEVSSDSSGTIVGDVRITESSILGGQIVGVTQVAATKKRHVGAQPTRLAALSASSNPRDFISNDYVSYDYADKAYRDLSITRGKGFTKEKNKKKRGSYRGGAIDISGGKGFKFED